MELGKILVEMLKTGYEAHFYWESNQNGNRDWDSLVINISKEGRWATHKISRMEFRLLACPDSTLEVALDNLREAIDTLEE